MSQFKNPINPLQVDFGPLAIEPIEVKSDPIEVHVHYDPIEVNVNFPTPVPSVPVPVPSYIFKLGTMTLSFSGVLKVATSLPDDKVLPFVSPTGGLDAKGNPTKLTGTVTVTAADATMLLVTQPDPTTPNDPNSGTITAVGPLGTSQVKFEDTGDGAAALVALVDIEVLAGATVAMAAPTFGALRDATPPPAQAPTA